MFVKSLVLSVKICQSETETETTIIASLMNVVIVGRAHFASPSFLIPLTTGKVQTVTYSRYILTCHPPCQLESYLSKRGQDIAYLNPLSTELRSRRWLVRGWKKIFPALAQLFGLAWVLLNNIYQPFFTSL